jgi:hypothetical protein
MYLRIPTCVSASKLPSSGVFSREIQELSTPNYTVNVYTLKITEHTYVMVSIHKWINVQYLELEMLKHYAYGASSGCK